MDTVVRVTRLKRDPCRTRRKVVATEYVKVAHTSVKRALVKSDAGEAKVRATSDTASTTKMVEMRVLKISSVKRVKYRTKLLPEVTAKPSRMADVHNPVHAYSGKKGK